MRKPKTKIVIGVLTALISYLSLNSLYRSVYPNAFSLYAEDRENAIWLATSKSWLDRKACRWLSVCGASHFRWIQDYFGTHVHHSSHNETVDWSWEDAWTARRPRTTAWSNNDSDSEQQIPSDKIPDYVFEYAPLVHLFSGEQFWPCDIAEHLYHTTPSLNYTQMQSRDQHKNLTNLNLLNDWERGRWVFLTSNDNVEERPEWLEGSKNIPTVPPELIDKFDDNDGWTHYPGRPYLQGLSDAVGGDLLDWFGAGDHSWDFDTDAIHSDLAQLKAKQAAHLHEMELKRDGGEVPGRPQRGGRSDAPAVLIVVDKGNGIVDAFWFFFYSFNLGNVVLNIRFGNHVGDWEHTAVRFQHGQPKAVFFSEHNFGSAYSYEAVEKFGKRPVIYSATGTHAMYATPGLHPYVLPWGILHDETDRGPLWDPALNVHSYTYDAQRDLLHASSLDAEAPTEWFHFAGHWGDKFYPLGDKRQYRFAGQYHYVNGPLGPKFKRLGRKKICGGPDSAPCVIRQWLGGLTRPEKLQSSGEDADIFSALSRGWATEGLDLGMKDLELSADMAPRM